MQELFERLTQLKVDEAGAPDPQMTKGGVCRAIAEHAQASAAAINLGMWALGASFDQDGGDVPGAPLRGPLNRTAVHPREVAVPALELHSAAVVLVHNHPSGLMLPSTADEALSTTLKNALQLIGVEVLEHVIVGPYGAL